MKNIFFLLYLSFITGSLFAQTTPTLKKSIDTSISNSITNDSIRKGSSRSSSNKDIKNKEAKITDYLIISHTRDTTYVDTTLTIAKDYKFNYLRKDNFELMPFANLGQTYNTLSYNFENTSLMPEIGARAKHFNFMEIDDINYYHVPTPLTELFYKSGFEQGQVLDAFFTVNTSNQFNFSIAYKGNRSLGNYQNILSSSGNFRFTSSYKTKNGKYIVNAHFVAQDILNEENGGLQDDNIAFFESGDESFLDRGVLEVNFENAENILKGKRFYLNQTYKLIKTKDSLSNNSLSINHIINLDDKNYKFEQTTSDEFFGESFRSRFLKDEVTLENLYNKLELEYSNKTLGEVKFNVSHNNYNYGYDKLVILDGTTITNRLKGNVVAFGGDYKKQINGFNLEGAIGINISGDLEGNFLNALTSYKLNDDLKLGAQININSKAPNYNTQLYQSSYLNYNWNNNFSNVETKQFSFNIKSNKFLTAKLDITNINNYVYFAKETTSKLVKPLQNEESISYLRLKLSKSFSYKNFTLTNTLLYQNIKDDNGVLNMPELITRNTFYYSNHLFKKALYLQTGVTLKYFSAYSMDGYDPLLGEFYIQTEEDFGGFPMLDFFINAKVRQTRIYFKAEHLNSSFTGYDYYSAPNQPYRDFTIRFGIVWNFFL